MLAIRQFQEERNAWEAERQELERTWRAECARRAELEAQLSQAQAQAAAPQPPAAPSLLARGADAAERGLRPHHEKQLALMATIDSLRRELTQEQEKTRTLERRTSQTDLDGTRSSGPKDEELEQARQSIERQREEVRNLEDETLRLRESLNSEKQKVVDLKRAAHTRAVEWKAQLSEIMEELAGKQQLSKENEQLRAEKAALKKEVEALSAREAAIRGELERTRREVALRGLRAEGPGNRQDAAEKIEEMEILSSAIGGQLVAVEQELTKQVHKSSQVMELLRQAREPLQVLRRYCALVARELLDRGYADDTLLQPAPSLCEGSLVVDLQESLAKFLSILRYAANVLEAQERHVAGRSPPGLPGKLAGGGDYSPGNHPWPSALGLPGWVKDVFAA